MSEKKRQTALRQVASLLKDWPEPHGSGSLAVKGVDLQNGHLRVAIEPAMSQCPCCLVDLSVLRVELAKKKGGTHRGAWSASSEPLDHGSQLMMRCSLFSRRASPAPAHCSSGSPSTNRTFQGRRSTSTSHGFAILKRPRPD